MGVPKRLTEKQIKFAQLVVSNEGRMNGTECAKEAGYGEAARIRAYELQNPKKYPLVVKYIGELREENQRKYSVNFERHITELAKIRQDAPFEKVCYIGCGVTTGIGAVTPPSTSIRSPWCVGSKKPGIDELCTIASFRFPLS